MTITLFRIAAFAEACSWLGLLIGMGFKYIGDTEAGVQLFGPIHGGLFMAYLFMALLVSRQLEWSPKQTMLALAAAVPPFVTLLVERQVRRDVDAGDAIDGAAA